VSSGDVSFTDVACCLQQVICCIDLSVFELTDQSSGSSSSRISAEIMASLVQQLIASASEGDGTSNHYCMGPGCPKCPKATPTRSSGRLTRSLRELPNWYSRARQHSSTSEGDGTPDYHDCLQDRDGKCPKCPK
jgi:hypothetical protein